jgi:hypothetical protein
MPCRPRSENTIACGIASTPCAIPSTLALRLPVSTCQRWPDVTEVGDIGPSLGEDGVGVGVDLTDANGAPAGSLKPKIKTADA